MVLQNIMNIDRNYHQTSLEIVQDYWMPLQEQETKIQFSLAYKDTSQTRKLIVKWVSKSKFLKTL